jgi:hypothetical protein
MVNDLPAAAERFSTVSALQTLSVYVGVFYGDQLGRVISRLNLSGVRSDRLWLGFLFNFSLFSPKFPFKGALMPCGQCLTVSG